MVRLSIMATLFGRALITLQIIYVLYRALLETRCGQQITACLRPCLVADSPISMYVQLRYCKGIHHSLAM